MKQTRILMGMPVTIEIVDPAATEQALAKAFAYFDYIDGKFSTYKDTSEISSINRHEISIAESSEDMRTVFALAEETRRETDGYFDIRWNETYDPSGLVKGWAIYHVGQMLREDGFANFYVEAGGDIEATGKNGRGQNWRAGIRNPFNLNEIVKVLSISDAGIATSGTYVRGRHIYDPTSETPLVTDVVSLTVIGPNVYEADRFATAAFAMGREGIFFIESRAGLEGYLIDEQGQATFTSGWERFVSRD